MRGRRAGRVGGARGKSRLWRLNIACEHLARRRRTSSTSTRVREVGQGVTKKEPSFGSGGKQPSELFAHGSIANPATRKSTQFNLGLKEEAENPVRGQMWMVLYGMSLNEKSEYFKASVQSYIYIYWDKVISAGGPQNLSIIIVARWRMGEKFWKPTMFAFERHWLVLYLVNPYTKEAVIIWQCLGTYFVVWFGYRQDLVITLIFYNSGKLEKSFASSFDSPIWATNDKTWSLFANQHGGQDAPPSVNCGFRVNALYIYRRAGSINTTICTGNGRCKVWKFRLWGLDRHN